MDPQYPKEVNPDLAKATEEHPSSSKFRDSLVELIEFVAIVAAVLIVLRFFIAEPHRVSGSSMVPNFHDGDYIITNKLAKSIAHLERGEVIILHNPRNTDQVFIKRIVGLPGEKIQILDGQVYINGKQIQEPYLPQGLKTSGGAFLPEGEEITIPDNQYFVMGDNRNGSSDSREWGTVEYNLVIGQAWARYWPAQKFGIIPVDKPSN